MQEIVCLEFQEYDSYGANGFTKYVIKDENFEKKLNELQELCYNYDNFQEIEDFIVDNFKEIKVEKYEITY